MPARIYAHVEDTTTDKLVVVLEFFDHPNLRQYYTGLIADIVAELDKRGVDRKTHGSKRSP